MAFTDFNKLMLKFGENMTKPQSHDCLEERPGSPFILLLSKESEAVIEAKQSANRFFEEEQNDSSYLQDSGFLYNSINSSCDDLLLEHNIDTSYEFEEDADYEEIYGLESDAAIGSNEVSSSNEAPDNALKNLVNEDIERSHRDKPMTKQQFQELFDSCGRLVNEHELRRAIFKGGIEDNIRKDVWQFLFELYPFNSTTRERESIRIEQIVRYEALKMRWKKLLKKLINDYEGVSYCPKWYTGCSKNLNERKDNESPLVMYNKEMSNEVKAIEKVNDDKTLENCKCIITFGSIETKRNSNLVHSNSNSSLNSTDMETKNHSENNSTKQFDTEDGVARKINFSINNDTIDDKYKSPDESKEGSISPSMNTRVRTESLNFECKEIEGLSEALEDAMRDVEANEIKYNEINKSQNKLHDNLIVNNQESLYSKSENIETVDLMIYGEKVQREDTKDVSLTKQQIDTDSESNSLVKTDSSLILKDVDDLSNNNNNTSTVAVDHEVSVLTENQKFVISVEKTEDTEATNSDRSVIVKTPTGEEINSLPPWIAHMMNSTTSFKPIRNNTSPIHSSTISVDHWPSDLPLPVRTNTPNIEKSDTKHNEELLDIVENANRYLQKQMENLSSSKKSVKRKVSREKRKSNSVVSTPTKDTESKRNSVIMSPMKENERPYFMESPRLRFVSKVSDKDLTDGGIMNSIKADKCPYCDFAYSDDELSVEMPIESMGKEQLKFMGIQAQVFAARQPYREDLISSSVRVIDKDVPRTDRELPQFSGNSNPGLLKLRDSLLTYAFFHPEVGYAQGMNDIMSRFLYVTDNEVDAYWMFVNYMEHFKNDFMEEGMLRKIVLVEQLLMKMDRELYDFLQSTDMGLMFCHRWLLLNFKREFNYLEAIRLFEITSSRHLEVSSVEAELERDRERARDFLHDNGGSVHMEEVYMSPEYPFDIFVCVAMLTECRAMIMETTDLNSVYQVLSNLPKAMELQVVLRRSEELFYQFCRKSVVDCFQVIDELEIEDFRKKKSQSFFGLK